MLWQSQAVPIDEESRVADGGTEESLVSCPTKNKTRRDERLSGLWPSNYSFLRQCEENHTRFCKTKQEGKERKCGWYQLSTNKCR